MVPDVFDKKGTLPYFYLSWSSFHPTHHGYAGGRGNRKKRQDVASTLLGDSS